MPNPFVLPGKDSWICRLVMIGSHLQLEATRGDLRCTTWLTPLQSPLEAAYALTQNPSCCLSLIHSDLTTP
jgi:hypothetical protein